MRFLIEEREVKLHDHSKGQLWWLSKLSLSELNQGYESLSSNHQRSLWEGAMFRRGSSSI